MNKFREKLCMHKNLVLNFKSGECPNKKLKETRKENDQKQYREEAEKKGYIFQTQLQTQPWWRRSW